MVLTLRLVLLFTFRYDAGTITTPIVGGSLKSTDIYPFTDYEAERTKSYEFGLTARFWKKLSFDFTWYKSNTYKPKPLLVNCQRVLVTRLFTYRQVM